MKCPKCNQEIANGVKFCTKCGANIEETKKALEEMAKKEAEEKAKQEKAQKEVEKKLKEENARKAEETKTQKEAEKKEDSVQKKDVKKESKRDSKKSEEIDATKKEVSKDTKSEPKTANTEKKKSSKKGIIIAIIVLVLIAGAVAGGIIYWKMNQDNDEEEEQQKLEWGDVYLEVLNDNEKLDDMDNQKIQLCDLDKDSIPELIIYGVKNAKEYIANIYKINDKNEVDTIKVSLDNEFDLKLIYDANRDDYVWYAVAKQSDDTTKIYDLNIDEKEYKSEEVTLNFGTDALEIEENYSEKVDFDKNASKDDKKEVFTKAKEKYVPTEDMITDEVKEKVENIKVLKNISKIDPSKEIVYSVVSKKVNGNTFEYPCININSDEVIAINSEIKENYGFSENLSEKTWGDEIPDIESEEISYKYTINGTILSLVVWDAGNESIWADTYNIDLKTSKEIVAGDLISQYGFKSDEVISKATEVVTNEYNTVVEKEKKALGSIWTQLYDNDLQADDVAKWKTDIQPYIEELHLLINEHNELCILGKYEHVGGQWACTQTVIVNITNGYKLSEMTFKDGTTFNHSAQNYTAQPSTSPSASPSTSSNTTSSNTLPNVTFAKNGDTVVPEGTYARGNNGTLTITNSKAGQFDFTIYCTYTLSSDNVHYGYVTGTAKQVTNSNSVEFAYVEKKSNGDVANFNLIFLIADAEVISVDEQYEGTSCPYCGVNVTLEGSFVKK